jgi:hypothetical protein
MKWLGGVIAEVTFRLKSECQERASYAEIWEVSITRTGNSQSKGAEVRVSLSGSKTERQPG